MLQLLVLICGIGHIALCLGSLLIPRLLDWKTGLAPLSVLLRQMFWTYAAYILAINFCFGLLSVLGARELLDQGFLAKSITLFISLYWLGRLLIQFLYFDRSEAPKGLIYTLGEAALVLLFAGFTGVYFTAFLYNMSWI